MHAPSRISVTRLTRRASLVTIGAAGLGAMMSPLAASAKQKGDVNKRCKPQVNQCQAGFTALCGNEPECLKSLACCEALGTCNFNGFATCVAANNR
jgi:hypothetical protein